MMNTTTKLMTLLLALLGFSQSIAQDNEYLPIAREGVKWVNEKVIVNHGDTSYHYYIYEFSGKDSVGSNDMSGHIDNALYYYTGNNLDTEQDSLIAGISDHYPRPYEVSFFRNHAYDAVKAEGRYMIELPMYTNGGTRTLYNFRPLGGNLIDFFLRLQELYHELANTEIFLTSENFVETNPLIIEGISCCRYAYIGEQGDTLAYFVEGIGFDSYDMGDLLTPFTRKPDPNADYQEWCGLSHVIKDGQIIYKGMRYRPDMPGDEDEYEYVPFVREGVKWTYSIQDYRYEDDYTNPARGDNKVYRTLELSGDTVINGKTYKAMHMCTDDVYSEPSDVIPIYLREEDKMVYGIVPDGKYYDDARLGYLAPWNEEIYSGEEFLLYDFQDPVTYWDSIDPYYDIHLQVDTIEVGGRFAKRYYYPDTEWDSFQIIEGIGATGLNSYPLAFLMPTGTGIHTTEYYSLEKVVENGEVIYPHNYVEDRYLPVIREGVKWVNVYVEINDEDTTYHYYTYEFKGNYPERDSYNHVFKAVYSQNYTANGNSYGDERLVAGLREDEACIISFRNEPLSGMNNLINFYSYYGNDDVRLLHENLEGMWDIDYYINSQAYPQMNLLNTENFVKTDPIEIDGVLCSRIAYIGEQGDTLAYLVEGIGFDSYDMGDLLRPFTRYPEADCGECYQEYCGLSHVIKDGKIIYKGLHYRPVVPGDVDGDGEVTIADANSVADIVIMGSNAGHNHSPAADANGDGEITIADVNVILAIILSKL